MSTTLVRLVSLLVFTLGAGCASAQPFPATGLHRAEQAVSERSPSEKRENLGESEGPDMRSPEPEMLVVTGTVALTADDVGALVRDLRQRVAQARGTVMNERMLAASGEPPQASVRVRLPPPEVQPLLDWLGTRGEIQARDVKADDVSREFFDRAMAVKSLQVTSARLQRLIAERPGALADVLAIERELTRVRRELEQLEGTQRFVADQVARATLELTISPSAASASPLAARPKFQLLAQGLVLGFADQRGRTAARAGAGVSVMFSRLFAMELQLFPATTRERRSVLFAVTSALYSDLLGGGRRRFLNPYLGVVLGAGSVDGLTTYAAGALVGLELYRSRYALVDLQGRVQGFFYKGDRRPDDIALQAGLGVGVPF